MANPEHLKILKQGVEVWNWWRVDNPNVKVSLREAKLRRAGLPGADLYDANLSRTNFSEADLSEAGLSEADLSEANLSRANLSRANLSRANLSGANLSGASLSGANFSGADLSGVNLKEADLFRTFLYEANLSGANLSGANLSEASLYRANFSEADLYEADLSGADLFSANFSEANHLSSANFSEAYLSEAYLHEANLSRANLSGANFSGANLYEANLSRANFSGADLSRAFLYEANLSWADLSEADLQFASFNNTLLVDIDLRNVKNLKEVKHGGPSYIDISTLIRSRGNIPKSFLRGCGVPDNFIQYIPSLVDQPIQFYSCFISYSSKDQDFAERLYDDLQNKGVRCWYAPEDMKIGEKIRDRIDQSIRFHDKLLLVLSENSINSEWVGDEVESAYEQELKRNTTVLFPIRLDDAVMDTEKAWAAKLRRSRHIGDFTNWKNHDSYQKAFERLLKDLKSERE